MNIYKEGDIVKLKENNGSSIPDIYDNKEGVIILDDERFGIRFFEKLISEDEIWIFNDEDVELVGWTYIPYYELIKNKVFTLIDTDLSDEELFIYNDGALHLDNNIKQIQILHDSGGYYSKCNNYGVLSLQNKGIDGIYEKLLFNIEIRLDNTIKIFKIDFKPIDPAIIEDYKTIFYNYFEDCEVRKIRDIEYEFVIHFPEVTIKNELDKTHLIKDLYVLFNLVEEDNRFLFKRDDDPHYYLAGCRGTVTEKEYLIRYQHSHLNAGYSITKFCLGSGPILTNIAAFNMQNDNLLFEKIMLDIIDYVEVESIEGSPYIQFERVYKKRQGNQVSLTESMLHVEYLNFLSKYNNVPASFNSDLEININENNPKFIEQVSAITNYINEPESNILIDPNIENKLILIFKDEEVRLKIIKEKNEQNKEPQPRTADKRVCVYISNKLSKELTSKAISGASRKSRAGYFTGVMVEDTSITPECGENRMVGSIVYKSGRRLTKL